MTDRGRGGAVEEESSMASASDLAYTTSEEGSPGEESSAAERAPAGVRPPEEPFPEQEEGTKENIWEGEMSKLKEEKGGDKKQTRGGKASAEKGAKRQLAFNKTMDDREVSTSEVSAKVSSPLKLDPTSQAEKAPQTKGSSSPKLQALKARAAARRISAKGGEVSRPSTAPAPEGNAGRRRPRRRSSHGPTDGELRTQVDELADTVRDLEREKEAAEEEIKVLTKKHQEIEETTIKHYESIIDNLESEVKTLGVKVQEAESLTLRQKILNAEDSSEINLKESEFTALRREIEEQEVLLKGYQSENESAILKLKQMKEEMKDKEEKMAEEHASYARDLIVLQEERRVDSQRTASWLREKLELQKQNNALKEELYQSENKNKTEIERLRREKQELEAKSAGVNLKQMEEEEELVRSVKAEMETMKREHQKTQAELENKLKWYTENQEFVNQNSDLIKEQLETISELQRRLAKFEGDGSQDGPEARMTARIKELEGEVKHLNGLLVKNNPNSLSALIQASKPSGEDHALMKELRSEVESQKKKNAELMRKHESQLRALRQQHEKARIQDRETRQGGRVKELNKQLEDVRSHYSKKVKTLEKQLLGVKREKSHYQETLREERRQSRLSESSHTENNDKELAMIQSLKIELEQAKDEREQLRAELHQTKATVPAQADAMQRLHMQVQDLTEKLNELGQAGSLPMHQHQQGQVYNPPLMLQQQQQQQQQVFGGHFPKENVMDQANVVNRMRQLESELAYLKGGSTKPSYSPEYIVLEEKLAQMDARQIAREEQWRAVMEETKNLASLQQNVLNQKWELAIRAKNAEIDRFRTELDAILFDVSNLQRRKV